MCAAEQTLAMGRRSLIKLNQPFTGTNMNRFRLAVFCLAATLGVGGCDMSKPDSSSSKQKVSTTQVGGETNCNDLTGNAKDICVAEEKGRASIAEAEFAAREMPSDQHRYDLQMARAEAAYAVAKERCDDLSGNANDVCRKEAEGAYAAAKADATLAEKTADASAIERDAAMDASETARETTSAAREDAVETKLDAEYAIAKAKCDVFAGDAKDQCLQKAEAQFAHN